MTDNAHTDEMTRYEQVDAGEGVRIEDRDNAAAWIESSVTIPVEA